MSEISIGALNIITALNYRGVGNAWIYKREHRDFFINNNVYAIVEVINKKGNETSLEEFEKKRKEIENIIAQKIRNGNLDGVIALGDEEYEKYVKCRVERAKIKGKINKKEIPVVLFYKGDISLLSCEQKNAAVIGLLKPDDEIIVFEEMVVGELVKDGFNIVSGLALGCDSVAHRKALDSGGKTVAILPSPIDYIYPEQNINLAKEIVEKGGLLISEYYLFKISKSNFIERDRLQALFSDVVVLTASYSQEDTKKDKEKDSGSRHAMEKAKEYGILRAVLYDEEISENNEKFNLNRELMSDPEIFIFNKKNISEVLKKMNYKLSAGIKKHTSGKSTNTAKNPEKKHKISNRRSSSKKSKGKKRKVSKKELEKTQTLFDDLERR